MSIFRLSAPRNFYFINEIAFIYVSRITKILLIFFANNLSMFEIISQREFII